MQLSSTFDKISNKDSGACQNINELFCSPIITTTFYDATSLYQKFVQTMLSEVEGLFWSLGNILHKVTGHSSSNFL